ncbi:MAG: L-seryl-tRNA(Sec) selenium transferase [Desulfurivibrio sp.]|nr:L-seryl-tRNA(Sec) selenium transferase [Desulfurivibrio sp.]MBU3937039.1 L-seryl-tRNA(Sec) selenium transferase [Pseudomonadota bacterium]MBU4033632.1 L-seryl-tRNA(Sec) selenium transferase [Pseudomonadota bacterium]MBU4119165.1 L-seryl-tRNA(Sec) selenium transferase [Pseudomonadota bacterium]
MTTKPESAGKPAASTQRLLQAIPKVDEFLGWLVPPPDAPVSLVKSSVRQLLESLRQNILNGAPIKPADLTQEALLPRFVELLAAKLRPNFRTVINGTGVVIHTNLGRSLLPESAMESLLAVGSHYSNLELDLATGKRGSRYSLVEDILCELTGAEAGLVVNNNAAAVMLVLDTLAKDREVIVSRGQLVEIGGSFRIPEVMSRTGAKLVEVGATNRTHLRDYENAITEETALLLKVHTSNYRMIGFTSEVPLVDMVELGTRHTLPVMEDLGSGCLIDLSRFGLAKEPTVGEVIRAGVDVVTFSGDKLLGGPQAGLILGKKKIIDQIKQNPMNRALRIDKFTLAGLEAVLRLYFDEEKAINAIPTLAMLAMPLAAIDRRAKRLRRLISTDLATVCRVETKNIASMVGGGSLPEQPLPSRAVVLAPLDRTVNELDKGLRALSLPVLGRIEDDRLLLDMRTVVDKEIPLLANCLKEVFTGKN